MKYKTIVIDFPWPVKTNFSKKGYNPKGLGYDVMSYDAIMNYDIDEYADTQCDLFIWVTHTTLPIGLEYAKKWGFKYHCLITWDKTKGPVMLGFNRITEYCIYCYRGNMGIKQTKSIPTMIREKSKGHSIKPRQFYDILLKQTQEPRIDIFSRKKHIGFDSWGNQAEEPLTLNSFVTD